ncbi:MAG: group II intron reverse transcriptase/maturase [Actinomycetota bacterium]|nr:group II intron reverse transcriptase/maturase [Actinomycetota bacterium]
MPKDPPVNTGGPGPGREPWIRVSGMQTKLHRWAVADPDRRFDDLFNLVHDPATLLVAFARVAGNSGANTPGVDGLTAGHVEQVVGVSGFLDDLRAQVKDGSFRPLPVRQRLIPKGHGSGKLRSLGIPTIADRVVQAALKLVLEPIFESDFQPVSYGFRPNRRAHDAIAEIQHLGTHGYRWVLDADIEACFDQISHRALLDRVRARIKDKRVVALVKAFLKAGILTESGRFQDTNTGTPQGGILSPLMANIALSVLDEHLHGPWQPGGTMSTPSRRVRRRAKGLPTWRIVRYADDFAVLVHGNESDVHDLREEIAQVLATMGLSFSEAKTRVVHMSEGFDFLGFRIQWRRKMGTNKWHVYTFIADRPVRSLKVKIRAATNRSSQQDPKAVLIRLGQIIRGWSNYFRHAVCKHTFARLAHFVWWRVARWLATLHRWTWTDFRRHFTRPDGRWKPLSAGGINLFDLAAVPVTRYRYRGGIPTPWALPQPA